MKEAAMEIWENVHDFPNYKVSNFGRVINSDTGKIIKESSTLKGLVKVGLVKGGIQYTRSVALMVAEQFVDGQSLVFNTPVHLDGNKKNNHYLNLVWRPRWFAWRFSRQFTLDNPHKDRGPVMDVDTNEVYKTFLEASVLNCILMDDIWKSIVYKKPVFPTNQSFKMVK